MKDFFKHLLTGKDNETWDIGRVTWLLGIIAVIGLAIYEVTISQVSLRELAEALGIVSGAGGASVMMKKDAEPQ
jgi:hypothetical protein